MISAMSCQTPTVIYLSSTLSISYATPSFFVSKEKRMRYIYAEDKDTRGQCEALMFSKRYLPLGPCPWLFSQKGQRIGTVLACHHSALATC